MGRKTSLDALYRQHIDDLRRYLLSLSRDPQTAEDLVQEVFYKVCVCLDSYDGERIRPWLFKVAYRTFVDWYRKAQRTKPCDPVELERMINGAEPSAERHFFAGDVVNSWFRELQRLPVGQRMAVLLRDYYGFTYQEIAETAGMTPAQVKINLFRGRNELRRVAQLEDEMEGRP